MIALGNATPAHAADVIPADDSATITTTKAGSAFARGVPPSAIPNFLPPCRDPEGCEDPGGGGGGTPGPVGCDGGLSDIHVTRGDNPELGGTFSRVTWKADLPCTGGFGLLSATLRTYVVDSAYGGPVVSQVFEVSQPVISPGLGLGININGFVDLYDVDYPLGKDVEIIYEDFLQTTGVVLQCNPSAAPEMRLISCGGNHSVWGSRSFATGLLPQRTFGNPTGSCYPIIQRNVTRSDANRSATVGYFAQITCRAGFAPQIQMVMDLYDRTPTQANQPLTTRNSGNGTGTVTLASVVTLFDRDYPKGSQAEIVIEAVLRATDGSKWTRCLSLPAGLRYARSCEGLNTDTLSIFVGTGNFPTGVRQPPLECKQDHDPIYGLAPGTTANPIVRVTPHIEYCGYFDWGSNSQITALNKLAPTQIEILHTDTNSRVCDINFVPQGVDGTLERVGPDGHFTVQVLFLTTEVFVCEGGATTPKTITIDRVYQRNGTVLNRTPTIQ